MRSTILAVGAAVFLLAAGFLGAGETPPPVEGKAPGNAGPPAAPSDRRVVIDSSVEYQQKGETKVLDDPEIQQIRAISRHPGGSLCLMLAWMPGFPQPLFHPGIAIELKTRAQAEKARALEREEIARKEQAAAEAARPPVMPAKDQ